MESFIKTVRISEAGEEQLNALKRTTKITQWNILCRWALCRSLAEPSIPSSTAIKTEGKTGIEIAWDTFGGEIADILLIAVKQRCYQDGFDLNKDTLRKQFNLHLHRGISYLASDDIDSIEKLVKVSGQLTMEN